MGSNTPPRCAMPWYLKAVQPLHVPLNIIVRTLRWHFMKKNAPARICGLRVGASLEVPYPTAFRPLAREVLRMNLSGKHVLDLETGTGVLALAAARAGAASVVAVDQNPAAVHLAARNAALNELVIHCRAGELFSALPEQKFDVIFYNGVSTARQQHIDTFLQHAGHWLAPAGIAHLILPPEKSALALCKPDQRDHSLVCIQCRYFFSLSRTFLWIQFQKASTL